MIGRAIGENHGEQCTTDDPYWWCDDCRSGIRPKADEWPGWTGLRHGPDHNTHADRNNRERAES